MGYKTHGLETHPLYSVWSSMLRRCANDKCKDYKYYGGRGIKVCAEWVSVQNFIADVFPSYFRGASFDRINNDGDYEPSNVRWVTHKEQCRNRRSNRQITFEGKTQTLVEWAEEKGLLYTTLQSRLNLRKWSIEKSLTTPLTTPRKIKL